MEFSSRVRLLSTCRLIHEHFFSLISCMWTYTHTHTRTHTYAHTHTHVRTHACTCPVCHVSCSKGCSGPGPGGCVECLGGYMKEEGECRGELGSAASPSHRTGLTTRGAC